MDEQRKYEVIKKLVDENGNKDRAAMTLNITRRQVNRLIIAYKARGKDAFVHGNRGRKPSTAIPIDIRERIISLYQIKYYDANFAHFTELLQSHEHISVSTGTVASILEKEYILSPKVTRAKKKRIAKELRQKQNAARTQKEKGQIQKNIVAVEDAHAETGCWLFGLYGANFSVNSAHHQAVGRVAEDFHVIQTADDGVIEAIHCGTRPILALQWHPDSPFSCLLSFLPHLFLLSPSMVL